MIMSNSNEGKDGGRADHGAESYGNDRYKLPSSWVPNPELQRMYEEEDRKRDPRAYADPPEMLLVETADYFLDREYESLAINEIFGPFWHEMELTILFSQSGVGKSALATQIAECLARGKRIRPFDERPAPAIGPQKVLYIDFELDRAQFRQRYSVIVADGLTLGNKYEMSPNFLRGEDYWDGNLLEGYYSFTDMLLQDIRNRVTEHDVKVLIIDNITFLTPGTIANSTVAFQLMQQLQKLKKALEISILVVAHTPKSLRPGRLTERDLQGSGDLIKVADSIFAVARSRRSPELRYLKQIKCRSGRPEYGDDNVAVFRLAKFDLAAKLGTRSPDAPPVDNFLGFDFVASEPEDEHHPLPWNRSVGSKRGPKLDLGLIRSARSLALRGFSSGAIAEKLGISRVTAYRYSKKS